MHPNVENIAEINDDYEKTIDIYNLMNEHAYSYIKPNIATLQTLLDKLKKSKNRQSYRLAIEQMEESDFLITIPEFPSYNIY